MTQIKTDNILKPWLSNIFVKNKYAWIQLEVAPDMGLPNTRSMHFIWVDYMQYQYLYTIFNNFKKNIKKI